MNLEVQTVVRTLWLYYKYGMQVSIMELRGNIYYVIICSVCEYNFIIYKMLIVLIMKQYKKEYNEIWLLNL